MTGGDLGSRERRVAAAAMGVAFLLTAAFFARSAGYGFVNVDDPEMVLHNPFLRSLSPGNLWLMLTDAPMANWVPLTYLSFALEHRMAGFNPAVFHVTNVLLHAANAALAALLFLRLLSGRGPLASVPPARLAAACAGAALVFALHPLRVESVVWVSQRKDLLFMFFYLAGLLCHLRRREEPPDRVPGDFLRSRWWWATFGCFLLSGLSKGMAVSFPAALLVLDIWMDCGIRRGALREKVPMLVLAAAFATMTVLGTHTARDTFVEQVSLARRAVNALHALGFYVEKTLVPLGLTPFYPADGSARLQTVSAAAVLLLGALLAWKGGAALRASLAFYAVTAMPILARFQPGIQETADRFSYLPTLWLYVWLAAGLALLPEWRKRNAAAAGLAGMAVALFAAWLVVLCWRQMPVWRDSRSLWDHQMRTLPTAYFAVIAGDLDVVEGRPEAARRRYRQALALNPSHDRAMTKLALLELEAGQRAEGQILLEEAVRRNPGNATAWWLLARLAGTPETRRELYLRAVRLQPDLWPANHPVKEEMRRQPGMTAR